MQPPESDPPAIGQDVQLEQNLKDLLASDLASLTLGQLLGMVLSSVSLGERRAHLRDHDSELANGFFQRNVNVGSVAAPVRVPRTRSGDFRPQVLPPSYQRGYSESSQ
ncbi:MAG: transposase, partial [Bryobacterales bacterium]|nr:transposase [Bryobacterales bacterium]